MKRNTVLGAVAMASLVALSACGGGASEAPVADETEAAPVAEETEAAAEEPAEEVAAVPAAEANGTVIEIQMYTRDPETGRQVFAPALVKANVGDTIKFVPTDPTHQSQSIPEMLPAGVTGWEGKINEEVSYVIPAPGIYGYKCNPHYAAGMIGMIVVEGDGKTDNLEAAQGVSHPGLAGKTFTELFEQAATDGLI